MVQGRGKQGVGGSEDKKKKYEEGTERFSRKVKNGWGGGDKRGKGGSRREKGRQEGTKKGLRREFKRIRRKD